MSLQGDTLGHSNTRLGKYPGRLFCLLAVTWSVGRSSHWGTNTPHTSQKQDPPPADAADGPAIQQGPGLLTNHNSHFIFDRIASCYESLNLYRTSINIHSEGGVRYKVQGSLERFLHTSSDLSFSKLSIIKLFNSIKFA